MSTGKPTTSLRASARPSSSTSLQVGTVELKLGEHARVLVEVRRPSKAAAVAAAADLGDKLTRAMRGDSAAISLARSIIPPQVTAGLRLARLVGGAVGGGRLRSLWRRLPPALRPRAGRLARELAA